MNRSVLLAGLSIFVLLGAVSSSRGSAQQSNIGETQEGPGYPEHFRVFTGDGQPATLQDIVARMSQVDAVLVGEIHTDPVGHWIEAELFRYALASAGVGEAEGEGGMRRPVALSLEMFERDVQGILDEYLQDLITEDQFKASSRPWEHYDADYRSMVELAKSTGVPVLAANAPRRYVNRVSRLGLDALNDLSSQARTSLPPLPVPPPSEAYRAEWNALMANMVMEQQCPAPEEESVEEAEPPADPPHRPPVGMADTEPPAGMPGEGPPSGMPGHGGSFMENGLQAQNLWDASMAYAITTFLNENPGGLAVHMVGGFHVKNTTGTPEKVESYRPGTRSLVVHMDIAEDFMTFDPEEHAGRGDFVILTDESLDLNYQRNCADRESGAR